MAITVPTSRQTFSRAERESLLENGFVVVDELIRGQELQRLRDDLDRAWEAETKARQIIFYNNDWSLLPERHLLKYKPFVDLIEHPAILGRHRFFFGKQTQLLQYDVLRYGPNSTAPDRSWHRDFSYFSERPLSMNTSLVLDDMDEDRGPFHVVPGSHVRSSWPPTRDEPLDEEVAILCPAGSAIFFNCSVWHTGSRNAKTDGVRRSIFLYYGYWWMKRVYWNFPMPPEVLENAPRQRLELLGLTLPDVDIHQYGIQPDQMSGDYLGLGLEAE